MKRLCLLLLTLSLLPSIDAQVTDQEENPLRNVWSAKLGNIRLADSYLSPLAYNGTVVGWEAQHERYYKKHVGTLSWRNRNSLTLATTLNLAYSASISYLAGSISYGTFYHFEPLKNLRVRAGGYVDLAPGVKYNSRNSNNIASVDASATLYGEIGVRYHLPISSQLAILLGGEVSTPMLGLMFVPEMGSNYYEMWKLKDFDNTIHFSTFHNRYGVSGKLYADLQFSGFSLRLAYMPEVEYWSANYLHFSRYTSFFSLGTVVDLHLLAGTRSRQHHATSW